jgi:hypothetical protein
VTVVVDDGASDTVSLSVTTQANPVVDVGTDTTVPEGTLLALSFSFTDLTDKTHTASIDWGDGTLTAGTVNQTLDTVSATHAYGDNGVFTVRATVTDDASLQGADSLVVTVTNADPVLTAAPSLNGTDAASVTLVFATFADAGSDDTHTATIDWDDGTTSTATVDQSLGTVTGTHLFKSAGLRTVVVAITDDDGGFASVSVTINIINPWVARLI